MLMSRIIIFSLLSTLSFCFSQAQVKILKGVMLDKQSDEPIPYASVVFKKSNTGVLSDSIGRFTFNLKARPVDDTLEITSVGYTPALIPFTEMKDSASIIIYIAVLPSRHEAFVKARYNRALWFWRKIIANKERNDRHRFYNYGYEVYNKLELDLNNVNKKNWRKTSYLNLSISFWIMQIQ